MAEDRRPARCGRTSLPAGPRGSCAGGLCGFTLLEVMIALGVLAIALLSLLSLHNQSLRSVILGRGSTQAALLAQALMTEAELERFPPVGSTKGDFERLYPRQYPNFRWQRTVEPLEMLSDVRKVEIVVYYGPGFARNFRLVELLHNPVGLRAQP